MGVFLISKLTIHISFDSEYGTCVDESLPKVPQNGVGNLSHRGLKETNEGENDSRGEQNQCRDNLSVLHESSGVWGVSLELVQTEGSGYCTEHGDDYIDHSAPENVLFHGFILY